MSINITTPTEESQEAMEAKTLAVPPVERGGEGGSTVVVTPIVTTGTHIADITVDDETKGLYAPASESELPSGGRTGQILEKYGEGNGQVYWADKRAVPTGGEIGDVLKNLGAGAYAWETPPTIDGILMNFLQCANVGDITGADLQTASITAAVANNALTSFDFGVSYKDLTVSADLTFDTPYIALINNLIGPNRMRIQSATRDMLVRIEGKIDVSLTFYDSGDNPVAYGFQSIPIIPIYKFVSTSADSFGLEFESDKKNRIVASSGFETTYEVSRISVDSLTITLNVIEQGGNSSSENVTITLPNSSNDAFTLFIGTLTPVKIPYA